MVISSDPRSPLTPAGDAARIDDAVALAAQMLREADEHAVGRRERRRQARLAAIVGDADAQAFTVAMTDEVVRITSERRAWRRFSDLVQSAPHRGLGWTSRILLRAAAAMGRIAPRPVMHLVERRLRSESSGVVISARDPEFAGHAAISRASGRRPVVNVLGEAILSDAEANHRRQLVLERLRRPDVDAVSVKLSAICAHLDVLAFDETVVELADAVRPLLLEAGRATPPKFVNFDMEEYRDLALTAAVFRTVLDEPELRGLIAGLVLQAYLPDTHAVAEELCEWALERVAGGGAPVRFRLVKGANLAMEHVEAELHGWEPAPFPDKATVDSSYKALLDLLLRERYDDAVRVGLASHNLFDVAWGLLQRDELARRGRADRLEFEMLEGMAPAHAAAVQRRAGSLLMYTPIVEPDDFPAAIAYLVRRLDENTAPENFLTSLFRIEPDNEIFEDQAARFRDAVAGRATIDPRPRRRQDRTAAVAPDELDRPFHNEPDTDFTQSVNRDWITDHLRGWSAPALPELAGVPDVDTAMARAVAARTAWGGRPARERAVLVNRVGDVLAARRGELLAAMMHEGGKTVGEGDPEVSEAIDFARYYARAALALDELATDGSPSEPLGTVVVVPPWNFPLAIPLGGVLAALAAGNTVVLKPAPQTPAIALLAAECCWEAGIPREALQFLRCPDDDAGKHLITHRDTDAVILTGSYATARMFLSWRPSLRLLAETSGKNAMVITATADVEAAIKDLVRSAFGHAGQKCSAASLAIVEASVYDDPSFLRRLRDAVLTLRPGLPTDLTTDVGPLVGPTSNELERALTTLEAGESWLVAPRPVVEKVWAPGVRVGVRPGSWFATTECFGPVLGVVRVENLDEAIAVQNATPYGLTAGLHALDPAEIDHWRDLVEAGNLYVNRQTTGAVVQRQPFGGWKQSSVGATAKAGGPHYVAALRHWPAPEAVDPTATTEAFRRWADGPGEAEDDPTGLRAERNVQRFRPLGGAVVLRLGSDASAVAEPIARAAATALGAQLVISSATDESDDELAAKLPHLGTDRLRISGDVSDALRSAAHDAHVVVDERPLSSNPAIELPRWRREQAISRTLHRYGRVAPIDLGETVAHG